MKVRVEVSCPSCRWHAEPELEFPPDVTSLDVDTIWGELNTRHGLSECPQCGSKTLNLGGVQFDWPEEGAGQS